MIDEYLTDIRDLVPCLSPDNGGEDIGGNIEDSVAERETRLQLDRNGLNRKEVGTHKVSNHQVVPFVQLLPVDYKSA